MCSIPLFSIISGFTNIRSEVSKFPRGSFEQVNYPQQQKVYKKHEYNMIKKHGSSKSLNMDNISQRSLV
jgi:hypothetical protein